MQTIYDNIKSLAIDYECCFDVDFLNKQYLLSFMEDNSQIVDPYNREGHITVSAWTLNKANTKVLLINNIMYNLLLQPGGHLEEWETNVKEGVLRELREETGLNKIMCDDSNIFDIDIHELMDIRLPCNHIHIDLRFLCKGDEKEQLFTNHEASSIAWYSLDKIKNYSSSFSRLVEKSLLRMKG